jgi:anti-anti-sigma factor
MVIDDRIDAMAPGRRRFQPAQAGSIEIQPERERVRLRCGGALDPRAAAEVREEYEGLFDRGFRSVILDLSQTTSVSPAGISTIAAVDRRARACGVRLSVVAGGGSVATTLRRAGLLDRLQLEGRAEVFMDWSR